MASILFASDSFKGSISSACAAELFSAAAMRMAPWATVEALSVADGGEGTIEAVVAATEGSLKTVEVTGPLGDPVVARYGILGGGRAIIEMAAASGLPLIAASARNPEVTSSFGTGELIRAALDAGAHDISLAIGGSATNDCGMGCLRALGVRFLSAEGQELLGCGADLIHVSSIDISGLDSRVAQTRFHVMCDVDNPLVGERGATYTFGPQKGATPKQLVRLEEGMNSFAQVCAREFGRDVSNEPGTGAAGGLGFAAQLFLNAEMLPGIDCVLDLVGFDECLAKADIVVTGEGHADAQSAHGKVISGVARRAQAAGCPCIALVGGMDADAQELLDYGVSALVPTVIDVCELDNALDYAERNFNLAAERVLSLIHIGLRLEA